MAKQTPGKFSGTTPTGSGFGGAGSSGSGSNYPTSPFSYPSLNPQFIADPSIRGNNFDQILQNRGIRFIHRKSAPCPNIRSLEDNSHNPNCPLCDGNGIIYYEEKEIFGVFTGNSLQKNFEMQGIWEIGTATVTLPIEYPDGSPAEFNTYDQLVIPDFTVRLWELKEYEPRIDMQQQLRYPITSVDFLASAVDDQLNPFEAGVDYNINNGKIEWIPGREPSYDNTTERGDVYVASYFANPVYVVLQHLRELRITQELVDGQKVPRRLPQEVLVKRDFLANDAEKE
jgi:hypothetical protein